MGKILLLTRSFPPPDGGVERRYANLCRFFPPGSIEVCTSKRGGQAEFDRGEPYRIHRMPVLPVADRRPVGFALWTAWALRRVRRGDIGVVWAGNLRAQARMGWMIRRLTGVPYGISFYGHDLTSELDRPPTRGWKGWLLPRLLDEAAFLLANSEFMATLARAHASQVAAYPPGERLHVVLSGADVGRFRDDVDPASARRALGLDGGLILLTAARLIRQKGHATALQAFARIAHRYPDVTYVIAGTGRKEEELRGQVRELGLADRVRFLGPVPYEQMPLLHAAADVLLLTSRRTPDWTENFPNVCLEAMAAGKPVIAGRVGGVPEMVVDGRTGILVDPEDPESIALALGHLFDAPALRRAMGAAGRDRIERELTHERAAREIYAIFAAASHLRLPAWEGAREVGLAPASG